MLLDPDDVDEDGEWAANRLVPWSGEGPERNGSVHEPGRLESRPRSRETRCVV